MIPTSLVFTYWMRGSIAGLFYAILPSNGAREHWSNLGMLHCCMLYCSMRLVAVSSEQSLMGHWLRLGNLELLVVSDGVLRQDAGAVFGLTPRVMWEPYVPDLDEKYRLPMGLNSMVVRGRGKTVLVETGCGTKAGRTPGAARTDTAGALIENLAREGIRPEDVDIVVNTHLHFDHAGGNTVISAGKPAPAFPRA